MCEHHVPVGHGHRRCRRRRLRRRRDNERQEVAGLAEHADLSITDGDHHADGLGRGQPEAKQRKQPGRTWQSVAAVRRRDAV